MTNKISCSFTATYRMRSRQSEWLAPSSATLDYDCKRIIIRRAEAGNITTTLKATKGNESDGHPLIVTQRNANEQLEAVDVTVLVQVDLRRFEDGQIEVDDFERYVEAASATLLAKFPETVFFRKPKQ